MNATVSNKIVHVRNMRDTGQAATRTLVARFPGSAYVAERIDDELCVFLLSTENIQTGTLGDTTRRPVTDKSFFAEPHMTAAKMQANIEKWREQHVDFWSKNCGCK